MTDQDLLQECQYHLVEEGPDGGAAWSSGCWTREELLAYLTHRQSRYQGDAALIVRSTDPPHLAVAAGALRVNLPADWLFTISAIWRDAANHVPLIRSDAWEADHGLPTWPTLAGVPQVYTEQDVPTLTIQLIPAPALDGNLELLYVTAGDELTGDGVQALGPDELSHLYKYGALADALGKDGRGRDLVRAGYCQMRYQLGVEIGEILLSGWS